MAANTPKTKFMIFRILGKAINSIDCQLVFNEKKENENVHSLLLPSGHKAVLGAGKSTYQWHQGV
jgi:hypothetical protein